MTALTSVDTESGFSGSEYNDVAMGSELLAINLLSTKFDVSPNVYGDGEGVNLIYDIKTLSCHHDEGESYVAAIFRYAVEGKVKRKKAFQCHADFAVMYRIPEHSKSAAALGFCKNVGKFAAYPYFRSHVAQLSWNAGLNLPPLPAKASTAHIPRKKSPESVEIKA